MPPAVPPAEIVPPLETASPAAPAPPAGSNPSDEAGLGPRDGDLRWSDIGAGGGPQPLRVSMHVYADDPGKRFAIIDGQRRREGDLVQPGMPLLEIRRDGLRIGWQGRVIWVPR